MRLLLVRHGNTFGPGDKIAWVGAREDLALTESGRAQAEELGRALAAAGVAVDRAVSGPLQRTRETAAITLSHLDGAPSVEIDDRLTEIDYGPWGGLSDAEIAARGEEAALEAWSADGVWPDDAGWRTTEPEFAARIESFMAEIARGGSASEIRLVVTSNGVLRYVRRAIDGLAGKAAKVATGRVCCIAIIDGAPVIEAWNAEPDEALS